jgi:hypothetical protein
MSKARTLANLISDNAELADGQISVAEVVGAAPTASPTFTGNIDAGDNVKIRLGDSDDLQIYSNNNNSFITESGSGSLFVNASNLVLRNTSGEYYFYGNSDGAVNLYHNNEPKLATTSTGIDVTGDLSLNDGTPAILLKVSGAEKGYIRSNSDVTEVNGASGSALRQNGFMKLATTSTGIDVTGSVSISDYIKHSGDSDTFFGFSNLNQIYFQAGNSRNLDLGPVSTVFNQDDADIDFRVESDSNDHMLFVDAANNRVGINNSNPANTLDVTGSIIGSVGFSSATPQQTTGTPFGSTVGGGPNSTRTFIVSPPSEKQSSAIKLGGGNTGGNNSSSWISSQYTGAYASDIRLWAPRLGNHTYGDTDATNVLNARESETNFYSQNEGSSGTIFRTLNLNRSTGVIANPDGLSNLDFRVASDNNDNMLFVDAGNNLLHMGKSAGGFAAAGITCYPQGEINATTTDNRTPLYLNRQGSDGNIIAFYRISNAFVGSISVTSSGTTYTTTSDRRLKDNIEPIVDATDKLMSMKPVTHTWIADPEAPSVHGFIAQEMQEIVPEAVSGEDGGEEMMSMDYGRITPVLVAALQEATNEIKALKQRVSELEDI